MDLVIENCSPGVCVNCGMTNIGYNMYEFWDSHIEEYGTRCYYCGAPDWQKSEHGWAIKDLSW